MASKHLKVRVNCVARCVICLAIILGNLNLAAAQSGAQAEQIINAQADTLALNGAEIVARSDSWATTDRASSRPSQPLPLWVSIALAAAVLTITALLSALAILYHYTIRPLYKLTTFIQTVSSTSNLNLRAPIRGSKVIRCLARSFNLILDTTEESHLEMLQARYEVESASKGKSLFIAKVSHELRTPIHGITGMLRILLKQEQQPSKRQYIQMAQESAQTLLDTINDVLDFSKMQSGDLSLEHKEFDLLGTIRSTVEQLMPRYEDKPDLTLCWNIHPEVPDRLVGDGARMKNILFNLLGNAFKFTETGHVLLDLTPYNTRVPDTIGVRISVTDTGIGIAKEKIRQIFDPFTTADERTARLYSGTGLGLAIVKQVVDQMGGTIVVESLPGRGSTFTVEIPFPEPDRPSTLVAAPKRVAILAEDDIKRSSMANGLRALKCSVSEFDIGSTDELYSLANTVSSYDIIHIIKSKNILIDELHAVMRNASRNQVQVILSVRGADIMQTDNLALSEKLLVTLQPTSALDLLLMAQGHLEPNRHVAPIEDSPPKTGTKLRVLVADDARSNRVILKNLLEEAGHTVELVENGQQLLERLSAATANPDQKPFDVILTDIQMPIMDGLTATQTVRQQEREHNSQQKLPIVAVTSYAFPEECNKMLAMGVDHIITKPINPRGLNQLLSQIGGDHGNSDLVSLDANVAAELIEQLKQISEDMVLRLTSVNCLSVRNPVDSTLALVDIDTLISRSGNSLRDAQEALSNFGSAYREPLRVLESSRTPIANPSTVRKAIGRLKGLLLDTGAVKAANLMQSLEQELSTDPESLTASKLGTAIAVVELAAFAIDELVSA
ncbi:MAG: ATP-binding protein, partial [Pseudomonadota bacterium]